MSKSGTTVQYQYDANGLRVGKIANGTETTYTLHGKLLTHLKHGANEMHFYYDAQSRPAMVNFNGAYYMYLHNLQGDVVGLVDNSNNLVVEYKYDAWGRPTLKRSLTTAYDTLATLNPFRYRGYVYDEETGLYYLRSRYYNPALGRFLNADAIVIISRGLLYNNDFAYCRSNPIVYRDENGHFINLIIGKLIDLAIDKLGYADKLNEREVELIKKHPLAAIDVFWAKNTAEQITKNMFGANWNSDHTKENAFKHCLWNALMAYKIGEDLAREFGEAHEYGKEVDDPEGMKMDLYNNEVGYMLVRKPPADNEIGRKAFAYYAYRYENLYQTGDWEIYIIINRVENALWDGTLIYLK